MSKEKKPRRKFTEEEKKIIYRAKSKGLPDDMIADLVGLSETWYRQLVRDDDTLQLGLKQARANTSLQYHEILFDKVVDGDMRAIEFWGKTKEGLRTQDRVELTGANGGPMETKNYNGMTDDEVDARIAELMQKA